MNDDNIKNEEITDNKKEEQKTYDVRGLLIGAGFGILIAIIGITDILMGITVGMFLGLVIGTCIKKK